MPPATLKGKAQPVRVFHAIAPRAHLGTDLTRTYDTPFIGREVDLAILRAYSRRRSPGVAVQLVTVVGEPGIGKSRIVAELGAYLDRTPDVTIWRQGRCLPYGEGITYWALGEILKAHAGILESDATSVAQTKLERVLPEGEGRAWFRQRLLPLLGIEASSSAEREELFTAWRRFLEHIADRGPTVLVFEDLHWADESMLAFLEHLIRHGEGVPLLVVVTTRPELFERYPDPTEDLPNATRINLTPLSEEETGRLVAALLGTTAVPAGLQRPILDRAGGNPLYAEEFVRLLRDQDLVVKTGTGWELREGAQVPFPHSVQALIAARLDTLPPDTKSILSDAAVVGKVFWAGAVAQMADRDVKDVTDTLRELSRKELVRPARRSSIEGESEYAFWHILARDVAYGQLPRASRASRHVAAARWIESKTPERVQDLADMLAYHYTTALELTRVTEGTEQASGLEAPALRFLSLAGERALGLDTETAITSLERALALAPEGHPERPAALFRFGEAAFQGGRLAEASDALDGPSHRSSPKAISRPQRARWARSASSRSASGIADGRSCRATRSRCSNRSAPPPSSSARSPRSVTSRRCLVDRSMRSPSPSGRWVSPTSSGSGARHARSASVVSPAATSATTEVSMTCARPSPSRRRRGRGARWRCSTTTSAPRSGSSTVRRRRWR